MDEGRKWTSITIRFKTPLVQQLREVAEAENRSFNGAVLEAVEQYLQSVRRTPSATPVPEPTPKP